MHTLYHLLTITIDTKHLSNTGCIVCTIMVYSVHTIYHYYYMTEISISQKKELLQLLAHPVRYGELRLCLLDYMKKTVYRHLGSFEDALRKDKILISFDVKSEREKKVTLYTSSLVSNLSPYGVAWGLCRNGYFSNLTSMYFHTLTNQVPKTVNMAIENIGDYSSRKSGVMLSDHDIFSSFVKQPRSNRNLYWFSDHTILLTERVKKGDAGVDVVTATNKIVPKGSRVTSLERGLIDAVVHPQYNGGIRSVVEFYQEGAKHLNVGKLLKIYKALDFRYPYWQAIGFLCDKTGASKAAHEIADHFRARNKFYIDHLAKDSWAFDSHWQIFYPKGLF